MDDKKKGRKLNRTKRNICMLVPANKFENPCFEEKMENYLAGKSKKVCMYVPGSMLDNNLGP